MEHGVIPLPKSTHGKRILENINIFDFEISSEDTQLLDSMNIDLHVRRDPNKIR